MVTHRLRARVQKVRIDQRPRRRLQAIHTAAAAPKVASDDDAAVRNDIPHAIIDGHEAGEVCRNRLRELLQTDAPARLCVRRLAVDRQLRADAAVFDHKRDGNVVPLAVEHAGHTNRREVKIEQPDARAEVGAGIGERKRRGGPVNVEGMVDIVRVLEPRPAAAAAGDDGAETFERNVCALQRHLIRIGDSVREADGVGVGPQVEGNGVPLAIVGLGDLALLFLRVFAAATVRGGILPTAAAATSNLIPQTHSPRWEVEAHVEYCASSAEIAVRGGPTGGQRSSRRNSRSRRSRRAGSGVEEVANRLITRCRRQAGCSRNVRFGEVVHRHSEGSLLLR